MVELASLAFLSLSRFLLCLILPFSLARFFLASSSKRSLSRSLSSSAILSCSSSSLTSSVLLEVRDNELACIRLSLLVPELVAPTLLRRTFFFVGVGWMTCTLGTWVGLEGTASDDVLAGGTGGAEWGGAGAWC